MFHFCRYLILIALEVRFCFSLSVFLSFPFPFFFPISLPFSPSTIHRNWGFLIRIHLQSSTLLGVATVRHLSQSTKNLLKNCQKSTILSSRKWMLLPTMFHLLTKWPGNVYCCFQLVEGILKSIGVTFWDYLCFYLFIIIIIFYFYFGVSKDSFIVITLNSFSLPKSMNTF